jgi:hypothetical protein
MSAVPALRSEEAVDAHNRVIAEALVQRGDHRPLVLEAGVNGSHSTSGALGKLDYRNQIERLLAQQLAQRGQNAFQGALTPFLSGEAGVP